MNRWLLRTTVVSLLLLIAGILATPIYAREASSPESGLLQPGAYASKWLHKETASNEVLGIKDDSLLALTEEKQNRSASQGSAQSAFSGSSPKAKNQETAVEKPAAKTPGNSGSKQDELQPTIGAGQPSRKEVKAEGEQPVSKNPTAPSPLDGKNVPAASSIGLKGTYYPFVDMSAQVDAQLVQDTIHKGAVVASTVSFSGTDGDTTYFSGSNPGVFSYFAQNLQIGDLIEVVDGNETTHVYHMQEKIVTDVFGSTVIPSVGKKVMDVYTYGSDEESIVLQYESGTGLIVWYGVPAPSSPEE